MMFKVMAFGLAICVSASAGAAFAQDTDDWEYGEDAARHLSAAVTRYESGHAFVIQCQDGDLRVAVSGFRAGDQPQRDLEIVRADGRQDRLPFVRATDTSLLATVPGRSARLFRGSGSVEIRAVAGSPAWRATFDLPSESANLDRVLTACGRPLANDRDALPILAVDMSTWTTNSAGPEWRTEPGAPPNVTEMACLATDDRRLTDCRMDLTAAPTERGVFVLRQAEGKPLTQDGRREGGQVVYRAGPLVQVSRQELF